MQIATEPVPTCHATVKRSIAAFRAALRDVAERDGRIWGTCPVCHSTLIFPLFIRRRATAGGRTP